MSAPQAFTIGESVQNSTSLISAKKLKDVGQITRDDFDGGPVSLDEIEPGLFLGNLTAATNMETIKLYKITHILTLDSVPLPKHITDASFLTTKFVQISDMPKEDILHHLDACVDFISSVLNAECNVLVHCYFGVSRSSSVVIAYMMKQHQWDYQQAYDFVKAKRQYVQPNAGFVTQLKLYSKMGCKIDLKYQRYKIYRLRLAGEQVRKAKILPQNFHNLIKPDPGITQENPEPIVYRCRKCRRVLATKTNVIQHLDKFKSDLNKDGIAISTSKSSDNKASITSNLDASQTPRLLDQIAAQIRKVSITTKIAANVNNEPDNDNCQQIIFIEPIAWMTHIMQNTQGRLNCPKCEQKLGNFNWIKCCQCPCGETVTPAFYLIPSKVELSTAVQNVQTTL